MWFKKPVPEKRDKKLILVIDDDESVSQLLTIYLRSKGYDTLSAANGLSGFRKALSEKPDLVLLDITMPKMDGMTTLLKLKTEPQTRRIPVVMCTDHNYMNDVEECCNRGADGYILKPFDLERVRAKVETVLAKAAAQPDGGRQNIG